jgi:hypothetical protein
MRTRFYVRLLFSTALLAAAPARAAGIYIPNDFQAAYSAYSSQPIEQPWAPHRPEAQLVEHPIGDIIAMKLGIAQGSAQLFRFRLENAPSNTTELRGQIDGAGIKLKLNW